MATAESSCTLPDRERLLLAYLGGTISDGDADRFEAHAMTCEECAAELERGVEVRAVLEGHGSVAATPSVAASTKVGRRIDWRWLAAAASVVITVSIWRFVGRERPALEQPASDVTPTVAPTSTPSVTPSPLPTLVLPGRPATTPSRSRGAGDETLRAKSSGAPQPVAARAADGEIRVTWPAVDKAARYVVTIFATNGSQLLKRETATPSMAIDAATAVFSGHADERLIAQVEAIDALGVTLGTSARIAIPIRRDEMPR